MEVLNGENRKKVESMMEEDRSPLAAPPTSTEMKEKTQAMENGTAPRIDKMNIKLIAAIAANIFQVVEEITKEVWVNNNLLSTR